MQSKMTQQLKKWSGNFGKEYTERNVYGVKDLDSFYEKTWGIARSDMNKEFLSGIKENIFNILEVGSNVGNQLACLQSQGFDNLCGIEIQDYAVEKSKELTKGINIIKGSAFDIPFKDGYFDLVFTSGVLIHIAPSDINKAIDEIYRCSKKYIWAFEYFAEEYTEIDYRGNKNLLWKANFYDLYMRRYKDLIMVKEKKFKYRDNDNADSMFLLEKGKRIDGGVI